MYGRRPAAGWTGAPTPEAPNWTCKTASNPVPGGSHDSNVILLQERGGCKDGRCGVKNRGDALFKLFGAL